MQQRIVYGGTPSNISSESFLEPRGEILLSQAITKSRQDEIVRACPDDHVRRFASDSAFAEWSHEVGTVLLGYVAGEDLAGIVFFRQKTNEFALSSITFAIRIYDGYRGRGLAKEIMNESHQWLFGDDKKPEWLQSPGGVWLSVRKDNAPAVAAYSSFGYQTKGEDALKNRLVMEYYGVDE